jgi:phosphocarrier protein HPr
VEGTPLVSVFVRLDSINDVKKFVGIVSKYNFEIDLISGKYVIDAKSTMGIFSLDLSSPVKVEAACDRSSKFLEEIKPFTVK